MTHDELAASLASYLRSREERVTWTNLELGARREDPFREACRPDVFSIRKTLDWQRCQPWTCEVKVGRGDFLSDVRSGKWHKYAAFSCRVFFAVPLGLVKP